MPKKYLNFIVMEEKPKTKVFSMLNLADMELGTVYWYPQWRKYVVEIGGIIFDLDCIGEIFNFLKKLKDERDEIRKKAKQEKK